MIGMAALLFGLCAVTAWYNSNFLATNNLQNLSRQIAMLAIFAIGEGIVILSGGIDLSVGSIIAIGGLLTVYMTTEMGVNPLLASGLVLFLCILVGLWHGLLVSKLNLQPFIVTLCSMLIFRGLARRLSEDQAIGFGIGYPGFRALGDGIRLGYRIQS